MKLEKKEKIKRKKEENRRRREEAGRSSEAKNEMKLQEGSRQIALEENDLKSNQENLKKMDLKIQKCRSELEEKKMQVNAKIQKFLRKDFRMEE